MHTRDDLLVREGGSVLIKEIMVCQVTVAPSLAGQKRCVQSRLESAQSNGLVY